MFQSGDSNREKKREGEREASSLCNSTICCYVGCRAAVLLHAMLVLGCASLQCLWRGQSLGMRNLHHKVLGLDFVVLLGHLIPWLCAVPGTRD